MPSNPTARVLVVEDDRVFAEVMRFQLENAGFNVTLVHDGESGQAHATSESFDLIITDYQMPRRDGEYVCLGARSSSANRTTPIFLCTAKGYEIDSDRLRAELQITEFFLKPFSPRELVERANSVLAVDSQTS